MSHRYSTALSHLILTAVSIFCLSQQDRVALNGAHGTYGIILLNSLLGIWKWGNPEYGYKVNQLYRLTMYVQNLFALPFIVATVWIAHGYVWELAILHVVCPLAPFFTYFFYDETDTDVIHAIVGINAISLSIVSYQTNAYYGIATSVSYAFNHYVIKNEGSFLDIVPAQDMYNYGLCFFEFFALKTLSESGTVSG